MGRSALDAGPWQRGGCVRSACRRIRRASPPPSSAGRSPEEMAGALVRYTFPPRSFSVLMFQRVSATKNALPEEGLGIATRFRARCPQWVLRDRPSTSPPASPGGRGHRSRWQQSWLGTSVTWTAVCRTGARKIVVAMFWPRFNRHPAECRMSLTDVLISYMAGFSAPNGSPGQAGRAVEQPAHETRLAQGRERSRKH
jgi:hypothetical protein